MGGKVINLCISKRGVQKDIQYSNKNVYLKYEIPYSEIVVDFFGSLKEISKGYASLDHNFLKFKKSDLVKIDIFINDTCIDAFSIISPKTESHHKSRYIIDKIKNFIRREQFDITIQA